MKKVFLLCLLALLPTLANADVDKTEINGLYFDGFKKLNASEGVCRFTAEYDEISVNSRSLYTGDIVIPETVVHNGITYRVTTLGANVFYNSTVSSVRIPKTITEIQDQYNATSVRTIVCAVDNPNILKRYGGYTTITGEDATFYNFNSQCRLIVPSASVSSYTANGWGTLCGGGIIGGTVIEANSKSMTYGDDVPELTWKCYSSDDNLQGSPALSCSATSQSPVGNYTITTSMNTLQSSDNITLTNATLYISKAPLTVTAKSYTIRTGSAFPAYESLITGFKNYENRNVLTTQPTFTCSAVDTQTRGIYTITPKDAQATNYSFNYVSGTLKIQDVQTMDLDEIPNMTYGDVAYTLPATTNEGLPLTWSVANTNIATVSGNTLTIKGGGSTTVTATQAGNDDYEAFQKEFSLLINKASLTITAENKSMVYGDNTPTYTVTYTGLKYNETAPALTHNLVLYCSATKTSNVGQYNIQPSAATSNNYNITFVAGTLTINKAPLTITAEDKSMLYGNDIPAYDAVFSGFKNNETPAVLTTQPTLTCTATSASNVGTYDIVPSGATAVNYSISYNNGTLTVDKASLTVTAKSYTITQGSTLPIFECIYSGFKNSDTESVLTSTPSANCSATTSSDPGDYDITLSGAEATNYSFVYEKGTLTIVENGIIIFADSNVKDICVNRWDTNGDGELSMSEAAAVTSLGNGFGYGSSITSFDELAYFTGLTTINSAFSHNTNLTSITIPNGVTSISDYAFEECTSLTSVTIPNGVTSIGGYAFDRCRNLLSITIPNSVTSIGSYAFRGCTSLTSIIIPSSVTTIGDQIFGNCNLSSISVASENAVYDSRNNCNAIINSSTNELLAGCKNTIIPNTVTSIYGYAFSGCTGLSSITIPSSVTLIGYEAFYGCTGLTSVTIPSSVTTIGEYAFDNCSGLSSIKVMLDTPISIFYGSLNYLYTRATLYVPSGSKTAYQAANFWKSFTTIEEFVRKDQTLDFVAIPTMTYGDAAYNLPVETNEGLALNWTVANTDIAIVNSNVLTINKAGTTTVTASNEGDENNDPYSHIFTLTVNKAPLTITAIDKTMDYGDAVPAYELNYSGFVNGESSSVLTTQPTVTCSARTTSNAGLYNIVLSAATADNYDITLVNGTMTINKAPLTITAESYTINQKDNLPEFGVTYDGFKNDETSSVLTTLPTITCDATDSETAGDFDITPSGATAMNYSFNYVKGTLTVNEVESVTIAMKTGSGSPRNMIAYSSKYALDFSSRPELKAYIACGYNSKKEVLLVHVKVVPPYTGMVIKTTNGIYDGGEYDVPTTTEDYYYANLLVPVVETGTVTPTETIDGVEYTNFSIGTLVGGGVGFVKLSTNWTTHNKSYLRVPTSLYENTSYARAIKGFNVEFVEGEKATAILNAKRNALENNGDYYDLQGRKVKPNRNGLYIHKGKKVFY